MKLFAPGGDRTLTATAVNTAQSFDLRGLIMVAIEGHTARRFDHHSQFWEKEFEMVTAL
jgi:hypothetical protein